MALQWLCCLHFLRHYWTVQGGRGEWTWRLKLAIVIMVMVMKIMVLTWILVGWVSLVPLGPRNYCWLQEDIHLILPLPPISTLYVAAFNSTLIFLGYFETVHCHTIFYVCQHFAPSIHHSLWVELLPYVQPRGLLTDIQGISCHSCHSHLSFTCWCNL